MDPWARANARPTVPTPRMSQGNPNESEGTPPVAIACATVDQETVAEAAASLRERGHVVRVVAGAVC